ncbi:putative nuclease HARBI1-like protein [Leptotrombidium deliense]|uniref:Putative nuclease HARBI1 n=1 Tax=Leptotrombidium deliense TaxID=299467 RepID=A0A443RXS8_9ACAR|nr:putative nuclease HARBI1-like protein [Leptotrombidium deliense]
MNVRRLQEIRNCRQKKQQIFKEPPISPLVLLNEREFHQRYRMSKHCFEKLLSFIGNSLDNVDNRNHPPAPEIQLLTALRYYATGVFQHVDGDLMNLSQATVCRIVAKVSNILAGKAREIIHFPEPADCQAEQDGFFQIAGFPGVIGVIDCTHVEIKVPKVKQERYRNRKNKTTLNVQVIIGCDMRFTNIVCRWPGSVHDSRIFRRSKINSSLNAGNYSGHLLGDAGYGCKKYLLTPLSNPVTIAEKRYQKRFIKTRLLVEQTFGCWKWKFHSLLKGLRSSIGNSLNTIIACAVLWNFMVRENEINHKERIVITSEDLPANNENVDLIGTSKRMQVINYFDY